MPCVDRAEHPDAPDARQRERGLTGGAEVGLCGGLLADGRGRQVVERDAARAGGARDLAASGAGRVHDQQRGPPLLRQPDPRAPPDRRLARRAERLRRRLYASSLLFSSLSCLVSSASCCSPSVSVLCCFDANALIHLFCSVNSFSFLNYNDSLMHVAKAYCL